MCECVLSDTVEGKIPVNSLLQWLLNQTPQDPNFKSINGNQCFQGDFISFFLNYIHEAQTRSDKINEAPLKASTPKRIERFQVHVKQQSADATTPTIRRRSALFENLDANHQADQSDYKTPKITRSTLEESYASPLSPLYDKQNFTTPRGRYNQPSPRITPQLCLGDFITHGKSSSKKKAQRNLSENVFRNCEENGVNSVQTRRINPTNLSQRRFSGASFKKNDNSFTFKNEAEEVVDNSSSRSFLVEERLRIMSKNGSIDNSPTLGLGVTKTFMNRKKEIVPLFSCVMFKTQLDVLVLIYNFMLDNNFILNLSSELYFLVSVLLGKEYEEDASPNNSVNLGVMPLVDCDDLSSSEVNHNERLSNLILFGTIHNRVYFASKVLQNQINVLKVLDRATLRLLVENKRLQQFSPSTFLSDLLQIHKGKVEKTAEPQEQVQTNVCFISDTDNRDNFPNDPSFHAFRKQRDLFYETLRIWENNHLQDEWNFTVALGGKIKALLNMYADVANLVHFARLFKAQLLMNTSGKNEDDTLMVGESQLSFLATIPNIDAEKLSRLKSRIVSKQTCTDINSLPIFTGYQEFYRDFLLVAANHMFNKHLNDALSSEIIELNNTKFSCSDLEDTDDLVDPLMQSSYMFTIKSLRILAKFLGFLESLPYKSDFVQPPQNVVACQIRIRNEVQPNINLKDLMRTSIKNHSLILTIPWITKYLAMLDYVTLRLPYFQTVLQMLFEVYYFCCGSFDRNDKPTKLAMSHMSLQNTFLVRLCLGWLFELPQFPEGAYYTWLSQKLNTKPKGNVSNKPTSLENARKTPQLDAMDVVDQAVLSVCCPYLQEIKKLLSNDASTLNNANVTVKHITPLTAVQSPTDISNKRIQLQLEEAFFNGQPVSIRKTVEFISERVASACIKQICNEIVPAYKKATVVKFRDMLSSFDVSKSTEDEAVKLTIDAKSKDFAAASLGQLRLQIDNELQPFASARIQGAVESLLATDVLKQTKDVCVTIATRTCTERMQQWINSHVNLGIFTKDFDAEVKHFFINSLSKRAKTKPVFALPTFGKNIRHNSSALSGVKTVENIRGYSWKLLEEPKNVETRMIADLLDSVYQSIKQRCDLNEWILTLINKMLVDLSMLLIVHRSMIISEEIVTTKLCLIWRESGCNNEDLFKTLICPRNVKLLMQSSDITASWKSLHRFISMLLTKKLLMCDMFKAQIVAFDRRILNEVTLRDLVSCLRGVVNDYVRTSGGCQTLDELRRFLSG